MTRIVAAKQILRSGTLAESIVISHESEKIQVSSCMLSRNKEKMEKIRRLFHENHQVTTQECTLNMKTITGSDYTILTEVLGMLVKFVRKLLAEQLLYDNVPAHSAS